MKQVLIVLLLLLASCQNAHDFRSTENRVEQISQRYGTSWKQEQIPGITSPLATIDAHIQDTVDLRDQIQTQDSREKDVMLLFLEARISMLKAEKHYQQARQLDPRPLAVIRTVGTDTQVDKTFVNNFSCDNRKEIAEATVFLDLSLDEAHTAINQLDLLMQKYPDTREIVGTNENRALFYRGALGQVWSTSEINKLLLHKCV